MNSISDYLILVHDSELQVFKGAQKRSATVAKATMIALKEL